MSVIMMVIGIIISVLSFVAFWAAVAIGIIKGKKLFVLIVLGADILWKLISGVFVPWTILTLLFLLIDAVVLGLYIAVFVVGDGPVLTVTTAQSISGEGVSPAGSSFMGQQGMSASGAAQAAAGKGTEVFRRRFCSQCGAELTGREQFCAKCGAKTS